MSVDVKRHGSQVGIAGSCFQSSGLDSGLDCHLARCFTLKQRLGQFLQVGHQSFYPYHFCRSISRSVRGGVVVKAVR
jgi:hypothetical protein